MVCIAQRVGRSATLSTGKLLVRAHGIIRLGLGLGHHPKRGQVHSRKLPPPPVLWDPLSLEPLEDKA